MFYYIYHFISFSFKNVENDPSFLQAKFSSGVKIIGNLKQRLSQNFPDKVFNNQLEMIQGFGSLITDILFCNTQKINVQWI